MQRATYWMEMESASAICVRGTEMKKFLPFSVGRNECGSCIEGDRCKNNDVSSSVDNKKKLITAEADSACNAMRCR